MVLVWQVISRSLTAYLAAVAPEAALGLQSSNPPALLKLADQRLKRDFVGKENRPAGRTGPPERSRVESPAAEASGQIRAWAELALRNDPLNARALRILGQLAASAADEENAAKLMQAAAHRSLRESGAIYWLMRKSIETRDFATALYYADALLRTRARFVAHVMPTLSQMAEHKDARGELKKLIGKNPPWRAQFFADLPYSILDARTPLDLLLSIKDTPTPPAGPELLGYLNFLIGKELYELAHYTWLQFLPPAQLNSTGFLFNGSFELAPSGLPFDWLIAQGAGSTVDIAARPDQDGQRALAIELGHGRVDFPGVRQFVMLAPGTYRFNGKYRGRIVGRRGLEWRITCAGGGTAPIGQSLMFTGVTPVWKEFEFSFTVPEAGCRAQQLRLELAARSASEQFVSGSLWYDELRISRAAEQDPT